jgi:hypothetical protein
MKSERRHELQHNVLADWLAKTAADLKPYQNVISLGVLVVLLGVLGYMWWSHETEAQAAAAWDDMNTAIESGNLAKLTKVIETYPGTHVANIAAVVLADFRLGEGCARRFTNKALAQQELSKAIELYGTVRKQSRMPSLLDRATFGLARAKETKDNAEEIRQAERLYQEVVETWPDGAYAVAAGQRLADLKRQRTKQFYDQFAHFDPKPSFSGEPGQKPSFDLNSLPTDGPAAAPDTNFDLKFDGKDKNADKGKGKKK